MRGFFYDHRPFMIDRLSWALPMLGAFRSHQKYFNAEKHKATRAEKDIKRPNFFCA
jgi:hypothetical protein